ncbi:TonB-dependent receptor plug domain-containing protein [Pelagicoccus enzymogenes]|uniref:TonB-dependent receptor plug domain-containing protein n=1 Tax=Pelagicoccus enzymogenes TaxID=2773457 RepID=UPI00280E78F6|nr:TonB-dependent receptor plug domain-containing protein [Pelagicoccus enzymogenes]MDQ8201085.1 TonB-dependent receptor plug domain-containing protein [Pelagicoccus enzymogenes]
MKQTNKNPIPRFRTTLALSLLLGACTVGYSQETDDEEVFELSPFEVSPAETDIGYRATNTLAGTRMNANIKDLGSSITVVTAQQLEDTAAVDLNDVFLYESNTEGTGNFTSFSVVGNPPTVRESIQQSPAQANRIRGIGSAERAVNYYTSLSQIPADSYNLERVTINRGPNSVLYGLGSASGLVNTTPGKATIGSELKRIRFRFGDDSYRGSFNVNQTIVEDKLAIYVAGMYQDQEWARKPSFELTRRSYVAATYKPFENTKITASAEWFNQDANRPNFTPPNDYVSSWIDAGKPSWNPITRTVTRGDGTTAVVTGIRDYREAGSLNNLADGISFDWNNTRAAVLIENGDFLGRYQRGVQNNGQAFGVGNTNLDYLATTLNLYETPGYDLWTTSQVNDKSIYDWDSINILSANSVSSEATTYELGFQQKLAEKLYLDIGFFKEDYDEDVNNSMGERGVRVDPNEFLLDGSVNPHFGKVYVDSVQASPMHRAANNEILRANLAYELDLTEQDNIFRHLGNHKFNALAQNRKLRNQWARYREAVISDHDWVDTSRPVFSRGNNAALLTKFYYVGEDGSIERSPGLDGGFPDHPVFGAAYPEGSVGGSYSLPVTYFSPDPAGTFVIDGVNGEWVTEDTTVAAALHDTRADRRELDSQGVVLQSFFWDDRIVTTLGWRKDKASDQLGDIAPTNGAGFRTFAELDSWDDWDPIEVEGETSTRGVVFHAFDWMSLHYNESDNFSPASAAVDFFGDPLPKPTGEGEDYGVTFNLFENKLVTKINWYEASEKNSRNLPGDIGRFTWRSRRVEDESSWGFRDFLEWKITERDGLPPRGEEGSLNSIGFLDGGILNPAYPYAEEIIERAMYPESYYDGRTNYSDTASAAAEGMEIEVIYNPLENWTIKVTGNKQESIYSDLGFYTTEWLYGVGGTFENPIEGSRVWLWRDSPEAQFTYTDGDGNTQTGNWFNDRASLWGGSSQIPGEWFQGVVKSLLDAAILRDGLPRPQVRKWRWNILTNYRFKDGGLKGLGIGGSVRWQDKAAIGSRGIDTTGNGNFDSFDAFNLIYDDGDTNLDLWASYTRKIWDDSVNWKIQFNIRDAFDNGGLDPISANPDGSTNAWRINDGAQYFLTNTFEF